MTDSTVSAGQGPLTEEFARRWAEQFLDAWNTHDPERLAALSAPDVRWEDPFIHPSGVLHGREELRRWLTSIWRALPDLRFQLVGDPFISLDRTQLGAAWAGTARFTGPLDPPGFAPTGSVVEMTGFDVHEFRDGMVSHVVTTTDVNAVARQIGAAPPPNSLGEKLGVAVQRLMGRRMSRKNPAAS
jgi:steroid delta-isomerase-like uncharacterized protein